MTPWPGVADISRLPSGVVKISDIRCRRRSILIRPTPSAATASRTMSYVVSSCRSTSSSVPAGRAPSPACCSAAASSSVRSVDLDGDQLAGGGDVGGGRRAQQPAGVDDDDVVADPLELAEQVRGHQDRDAELGADPADQPEHVVAPGRVEAVGGLVEQHQLRVVHQRLGQLDPLLHAGRVAADRAVPLLVEPDVPQRVGRAFAGRGLRQARHPRHVDHELGGRHVGRQAVVLGHVAHPLADRRTLGRHVEVQDRGRAGGRRQQAEHHLDQRGLARAVRADEPHDAGFDVDGQLGDGCDRCIPLGEVFGPDESHRSDPTHQGIKDGDARPGKGSAKVPTRPSFR